ncbi:hypothetical protein B296_00040090 [Ensete ventricosum]|uniref:Exocyst subunit Exo70 family protein n=1 Tax=Ensete ventricosum TaxID=4639 RepID=A0A426ZE32_ENSVE|nr:hypothetical protein B296_00040090 [Ensete ventricosum]
MGAPLAIEMLTQRASVLRESLQRSRSNTERMVAMLGSFDHRLSALESAMRPTQVRLPTPSNLKCSGLCIGSLIGRLQVRTRAIRTAHENIDNTLKATAVVLTHFELLRQVRQLIRMFSMFFGTYRIDIFLVKAEVAILKGPDEDLQSFLDAVDLLQCNIRFFSTNKISMSEYGLLNHADNLLSKAVVKLGDEFRQLLATYRKLQLPLCPKLSLFLNSWSKLDTNNGAQEFTALESSLQKLGVDELTKDDVQKMEWDALETKIQDWVRLMQITVNLLFAEERKICDQIFYGVAFNSDLCFAEVTVNSVSMLLSFGDSVAKSKRSPEKIFPLLDMYEVLHELQPEVYN